MRILVVVQSGEIVGGANRSLLSVLKILKSEYNHTIHCIVPSKGEFIEKLEKMQITYDVYDYYQTAFFRKGDLFDVYRIIKVTGKYLYNICSVKKISKFLKKYKFDCVYINDSTNTFGYLIAQKMKLPFLWHFRSYDFRIKRYMVFEKKLRNNPKGKYIVISNAMKDYMINIRKLSEKDISLVFNGIENQSVLSIKRWSDRVKEDEKIHCVECGAISESKGQIDAVKAFAILKKRGIKNCILHIAGSEECKGRNSYINQLRDIIEENELQNMIIFEGEVKNMVELRKKMHIELVCSVCEAFGRVTVEGMQAGLIVIGSNTGGTLDIIEDGYTGYLYEQGNAESLADKIQKVIEEKEITEKIVKTGYIRAYKNFSIEKNVEKINSLLKEVENISKRYY